MKAGKLEVFFHSDALELHAAGPVQYGQHIVLTKAQAISLARAIVAKWRKDGR